MNNKYIDILKKCKTYFDTEVERRGGAVDMAYETVLANKIGDCIESIKGEIGYFPVLTLHADDLKCEGYDATKIDDDTMKEMAQKIGEGMTDPGFWISLGTVCDEMKIPKLENNDDN